MVSLLFLFCSFVCGVTVFFFFVFFLFVMCLMRLFYCDGVCVFCSLVFVFCCFLVGVVCLALGYAQPRLRLLIRLPPRFYSFSAKMCRTILYAKMRWTFFCCFVPCVCGRGLCFFVVVCSVWCVLLSCFCVCFCLHDHHHHHHHHHSPTRAYKHHMFIYSLSAEMFFASC